MLPLQEGGKNYWECNQINDESRNVKSLMFKVFILSSVPSIIIVAFTGRRKELLRMKSMMKYRNMESLMFQVFILSRVPSIIIIAFTGQKSDQYMIQVLRVHDKAQWWKYRNIKSLMFQVFLLSIMPSIIIAFTGRRKELLRMKSMMKV